MVKITEKGQVTLPKKIREELDLNPGDEVEFEIVDRGARQLKVSKAPSLEELYGSLSTEKAFPGKDEVRKRVGEDLGEQMNEDSNS